MTLSAGTRVGSYEVTGLLGAGGMGEVYRARDTRLARDVAIKVLPEAFAADPERLARFEREAQILASLNHPNIAGIHGIEDAGAVRALVLEFVDGPTLADRIGQGRLPLEEALPIARQIAEALEAAHEHGIVHRDLKPANIKVREDGTVKVLDFGLAKLTQAPGPGPQASDLTASPTITSPAMMTGVGMLLGTAAYMSPEQAKGRPADKRSDVWAFGCVLYEMLTGKRAFDGEDLTDTIASVVKSEPDWSALPADVPPPVCTLIKRCLEKDRRKRVADVAVVQFILDDPATLAALADPPSNQAIPVARAPVWRRLAAHAATLVIGALLAAVAVWSAMRPGAPPIARFAVTPTGAAAITALTLDREIAITPNGTHVVYVGNNGTQLFVRALDQLEPTPLAGLGTPRSPFLSPDGQWIGFFDGAGNAVTLKKVAITGGPALGLCTVTSQRGGATWAEDGTIIFATADPASGLWRVPAAGGEPTALTKPDHERGEADHLWPELLPGGNAVLFTITPTTGGIETAQIALLDLTSGEQKIVVRGGSHAHYVPSGHLVYGVQGTLRAVAFDLERLEATGTPVPVLAQVVTTNAGAANFDVARDGTLVYVPGATAGAIPSSPARTLAWVDRQGREELLKAPARGYVIPRISPDGTRIALDIRDQQNDIWIWNLAGETLTRLTTDPGLDTNPVWMPDGRRIVFTSALMGSNRNLFWQAADGTGTPERLAEGTAPQFGSAVSPDGTRVVFGMGLGGGNLNVFSLTLDKDRRVQALVETAFQERNAEISPDGRWLAYEATDSGQSQVYVRPFPDTNSGRSQVSTAGGTQPVWARSGQELFYRAPTGAVMTVRVEIGTAWRASVPARVFEGQYLTAGASATPNSRTYDVSPDGRRFLMIKPGLSDQINQDAATGPGPFRAAEEGFVIVQNWLEELKRLVPVN